DRHSPSSLCPSPIRAGLWIIYTAPCCPVFSPIQNPRRLPPRRHSNAFLSLSSSFVSPPCTRRSSPSSPAGVLLAMEDRPRISPTASNSTYHSFNDIELQEPPSPPR